MEILMKVTQEELSILETSDIDFWYEENEICFDSEYEYERAKALLSEKLA